MKAILVAAVAVAALASNAALASEQLAKEKNCLACHAVDNKVVGPGYKEVAYLRIGWHRNLTPNTTATFLNLGSQFGFS